MNLLFGVFIVAGLVVYNRLPVDVYPDISLDEAFIATPYPGASPADVERLVTKKIEEELEDIPGVSRLASYSVPNVSNIFVKFREDLDRVEYEAAFQEVRSRLDRVADLPAETEEPLLTRLTLSEVWPIVQVVIVDEGGVSERVIREVARDLKDVLRTVSGVAKVKEVGLRDREVHILVDKYALERYGLSLQEVALILERSNQNIPGGNIETHREEYSVRAVGDVASPDELGDTIIKKSPTGDHVYLRDIAEIREDFERRLVVSRYQGKSCGFLYIAKTRDADSITLRDTVEDILADYRAHTAPPGVSVSLFADSTVMISSRLAVLKKNLTAGLALVFVVLWMFIGARNSMIAIVGIPFSFLCAFIFMSLIHVSLNAVSVFALVLVSGMIVDDAIVVLENIYRRLQTGEPIRVAIIKGTEQVTWPVVSSALTTIAAFLPLLIMSGVVGRFFAIIPKTVTVALLASLFECLIILPCHFLDWGPRPKAGAPEPPQPANPRRGRLKSRLSRAYQAIVGQAIDHRYLFAGAVAALACCVYQAQRTLAIELFPSDFPNLVATFNVHPDANLQQTDAVCQKLAAGLDDLVKHGDVKTYSSAIGVQWNQDNQMSQRSNLAQIWVELFQGEDRNYDPELVMSDIRSRLVGFADSHPQLNIENLKVWALRDGPPTGKPVSIRIEHPDYAAAKRIANQVKDRLFQMAGVHDISDNLTIGQRELRMALKEEQASEFGLTFQEVFSTLGGANEGFIIGTFKDREYDEDLDVRLKFQQNYRSNEDQLLDVDIKSPLTGELIKLRQVANLQYAQSYSTHYRHDGKRAVLVTADVDKRLTDAERVNQAIMAALHTEIAADDHLRVVPEGQFKETHESFASLRRAAYIAISLMYLILAAQFRSYAQPVIVLSALLFGTIGMVMGLVVNGYPFSVITGIAMVGLFGVMVNDAIVLLSFINEERARTTNLKQALINACLTRLRPIVLTTLTTVFGLLPMALGVGGYSKIWSPFATCICWGLTSATLLILLLLPSVYVIVEDFKGLARAFIRQLTGAAVAVGS